GRARHLPLAGDEHAAQDLPVPEGGEADRRDGDPLPHAGPRRRVRRAGRADAAGDRRRRDPRSREPDARAVHRGRRRRTRPGTVRPGGVHGATGVVPGADPDAGGERGEAAVTIPGAATQYREPKHAREYDADRFGGRFGRWLEEREVALY